MAIGPNDDGAELYREHLESLPCPTCGAKEPDLRAALSRAEKAEENYRLMDAAHKEMGRAYEIAFNASQKAEAALCRVRELGKSWNLPMMDGRSVDWEDGRAFEGGKIRERLLQILSSSSPCPHEDLWKLEREAHVATEEEAKRLREAAKQSTELYIAKQNRIHQLEEAVEWAIEHVPTRNNYLDYDVKIFIDELRRRAKEG